MIENFYETPNGELLVANGLDPVLRWDGMRPQMEPLGIAAPASAITLTGSGKGAIVGTYYGYVRFVNDRGEVSSLSPVSAAYSPSGGTGTITGASNATPIVITSTAHGLTTGSVVKITGVGGNTSANNTWTITVLTANTFSLNDSSGQAAYTGGGTWVSGVSTITYTGVPAATDPQVRRRQVLRNTDGQTDAFYVDVDTTDLSSSSLSSTRADSDLDDQTSQAILDEAGGLLANRHTPPPNNKAVLCHHLDRMFAAGQVDYSRGSVKVTFGSTTVTGVGTEWTAALDARYLYVQGARRAYQIASVDTVNQTFTLAEAYRDTTDKFGVYAIRPAPAERRLIYFSEAGLPASWPATNAISIQANGDEIVGLFTKGSFLYILERRHIHKFTFQISPLKDGAVFMSAKRGAINQRCVVNVDDQAYMLDEIGIHRFGGSAQSEHVSTPVQDLFRPGKSGLRINWKASQWFHAVLYSPQDTIRWFVSMGGSYLPQHALCYNYRLERFWIEHYHAPIGGSCRGTMGGVPRVFLGGQHKKVFAFWEGNLDAADPKQGTVRGTASSATILSLTDAGAAFSSTFVNAPLVIVDGRGKGQRRRIIAATATTLTVDQPWGVKPDSTSVYQVGGISWSHKSSWFRLAGNEQNAQRRIEAVFQPADNPCTMDIRFRGNFGSAAETQQFSRTSSAGSGVKARSGETDLVADLTKSSGCVQHVLPGHREFYTEGLRYSQVELAGVTNQDDVKIYQLAYEGVLPPAELVQPEDR